jgi:hypothetical protein
VLAAYKNRFSSGYLLRRMIETQENIAQPWGEWRADPSQYFVQAYRLYVLALARKPSLNAMNRLCELPQLHGRSARMLGLVYTTASHCGVSILLGRVGLSLIELKDDLAPQQQLTGIHLGP